MIQEFEFDTIKIYDIPVGVLRTNCYIIHKKDSKDAIIVDPGNLANHIIEFVEEKDLNLKGIFITHGHFDHIGAVNSLKEKYRLDVYIGEDDKELISDLEQNCANMFHRDCIVVADEILKDGQIVSIAGLTFKVINTPGHTKGSVCFYFEDEKVLLSGDTLFRDGMGRTDFPSGSASKIIHSIKERLFVLDDDVLVLTGHGESTTIGYERENNIYVNEAIY